MGRTITSVPQLASTNKFGIPLTQCWTASRRWTGTTANTVIKTGVTDFYTAVTRIAIDNFSSTAFTGNIILGNVVIHTLCKEYVSSAAAMTGNTDNSVSFSTARYDQAIAAYGYAIIDFGESPLISPYTNANLSISVSGTSAAQLVTVSGFFFK